MKLSIKLSQEINEPKSATVELADSKSRACTHCGCEKIYKNGHYTVKGKDLCKALGIKEIDNFKIQMYVCPSCGKYVKLDNLGIRIT